MSSSNFRIKYRRQYNSVESPEMIISKFKKSFIEANLGINGKIVDNHIFIKIDQKERHYWSPEMSLTIDKVENRTYVREVIGPNSAVFSLTFFLLTIAGMILSFAFMFLFSQISLEMPTDTTWDIIFASLFGIAFIFLFMFIGRNKAKPQMNYLRSFSEQITKSS